MYVYAVVQQKVLTFVDYCLCGDQLRENYHFPHQVTHSCVSCETQTELAPKLMSLHNCEEKKVLPDF